AKGERRSSVEEGEAVLADLQLVAVLELRRLDALAVHEGAVQAALVLDREDAVALAQHGVLARHGDVVEEDPAVGRPSDRRALGVRMERPPPSAAAAADDERRSLDPEVVERVTSSAFGVLRREGLRRFGGALLLDEERAATGAVVRGLRILEAAFL